MGIYKELKTRNMERVQRSRKKGSRLPLKTKCVNRGTKWGNPFRVVDKKEKGFHVIRDEVVIAGSESKEDAIAISVNLYASHLKEMIDAGELHLSDFDGFEHIACFCKIDAACHGDVIIEFYKRFSQET